MKNNSYTQNALKADEYLKTLKAGGVGADEGDAATASTTKPKIPVIRKSNPFLI